MTWISSSHESIHLQSLLDSWKNSREGQHPLSMHAWKKCTVQVRERVLRLNNRWIDVEDRDVLKASYFYDKPNIFNIDMYKIRS
jgi:hypothetical protein